MINTNGGFMKQDLTQDRKQQKQKWFLSALLIAALGSNYYFQTPSLTQGSIDLALTAADQKTEKSKTEGAPACTTCENVQLSKADYQIFLAFMEKVKKDAATTEVTAPAVETYQEKRERLAQERLDKAQEKADKLQAKKDKENDDLQIRNQEFEDKMEEAALNCKGDSECSTGKMINLLDRYSGKNKIDTATVSKVFNQYVAKDLRIALRNPESADSVIQSLQQIGIDIPSQYRFLKDKTIDVVKNESLLKGIDIESNFKRADELTKAKKPIEASQYLALAIQQRDELAKFSNVIYSTEVQSLSESNDTITLDYIKRTYLPDMTKLLSNLTTVNLDAASSSTTTQLNQPSGETGSTRGNSRADSSASSAVSNPLNQNNLVAPQSSNQNGIQIGAPMTHTRSNRGSSN